MALLFRLSDGFKKKHELVVCPPFCCCFYMIGNDIIFEGPSTPKWGLNRKLILNHKLGGHIYVPKEVWLLKTFLNYKEVC